MIVRKKPVEVEAVEWTGSAENYENICRLSTSRLVEPIGNNILAIHTLEGIMQANPGDFIIKGVKGEIYPCKPDIFWSTYEKVGG